MKSKRVLPIVALGAFALVSVLSVERSADGHLAIGTENQAHALWFPNPFKAIKNAVSSVGKAIGGAVKAVGNAVKQGAQAVGNVVKKGAEAVGNAVKKVGSLVGKVAEEAVKLAKKGIQGIGELAKKGLEGLKAIGELVKNGLLALKDLLGWVWNTLRDKLLKPVGDFFKNMIEKAKAALQKLIDKALQALKGIFENNVLQPALSWAMEKLFPAGNSLVEKVKGFVQRILGKAEALVQRGNEFADTVQALAEKNYAKFQAAMSKFEGGLNNWTNITLEQIAGQVVESVKGKIVEFVKGKTVELLNKAYSLVEAPINLGKTAALSAISSIPFAGGALAGAADIVLTMGLKMLRDKGFEFIGEQAGNLAGKAVDWLGGYLIKGAGALDAKLKPFADRVRPIISKALEFVQGVKSKWFVLRDKLKQAGEMIKNAQAAVQ
jgi:hypothetical protein